MTERTTVRLPDELVAKAKRKALVEGRSLTALIEEGLRRVLADSAHRERDGRLLPPVAAETGGLLPGVDLNDSAALQEMDDFEYVERMRNGFT